MKKITLALAVSSVLGVSSAAHALETGEFAAGVVVPHALYKAGETSTAIGITAACEGTVYWTFFDKDTKHIIDGEFNVSADDWVQFRHDEVIGDVAGKFNKGPQFSGLGGMLGYYLFVHSIAVNSSDKLIGASDAPCVTAGAWQIFPAADDIAYIPTLPVDTKGLVRGDDVTDLGPSSLRYVRGAAKAKYDDILYLNYADDAGVSDIVIWSAQSVKGTYTVNVYNTDQQRASTNLVLGNAELNVLDSKDIRKPTTFKVGFIKWDLGDSGVLDGEEDSIVSFSLIGPAGKSLQTVINPIYRRPR